MKVKYLGDTRPRFPASSSLLLRAPRETALPFRQLPPLSSRTGRLMRVPVLGHLPATRYHPRPEFGDINLRTVSRCHVCV